MKEILSIHKPKRPLPLVFDSPHSGAHYPADFRFACAAADLTYTEDKYVDELFTDAPKYGAALLTAQFPRSYIDPNRAADDIDLQLLAGDWPFGEINPTSRSDAGIGLIRRLAKPGLPVYDRALSPEETQSRIDTCYHPYHAALKELLDDAHYKFGKVYHVNCHSMPDTTAVPKRPTAMTGYRVAPVDFVLGNRDGTTCEVEFTHALRDFLSGLGHSVTINDPFKGVELIERHSDPARGRHSIQLEINKALYMNEETFEKSPDFAALKANMNKLVEFCAGFAESRLRDLAAD